MPFVENAFKHVSKGKNQPNYIRIALSVKDQVLQFEIENSSSGQKNTVLNEHAYQGIGLKNVRRRLELLYPENYQLDITNEERRYCVQLSIALQNSRTSKSVLI
ncbi:MAG: GHKL domain-containing protein [Haliscomenobacter sp.]|nr:GHKL domain-containing protein [Haliscomenobacter sp.]